MTETLPQKRFRKGGRAFVCVSCDRLAISQRDGALTCSPACRTWLHRHPDRILNLRETCASLNIAPALVQSMHAVLRVRPDLFDRVKAGELEFEDVRADAYQAVIDFVLQARAKVQ